MGTAPFKMKDYDRHLVRQYLFSGKDVEFYAENG